MTVHTSPARILPDFNFYIVQYNDQDTCDALNDKVAGVSCYKSKYAKSTDMWNPIDGEAWMGPRYTCGEGTVQWDYKCGLGFSEVFSKISRDGVDGMCNHYKERCCPSNDKTKAASEYPCMPPCTHVFLHLSHVPSLGKVHTGPLLGLEAEVAGVLVCGAIGGQVTC
jgi:hypothetical protein